MSIDKTPQHIRLDKRNHVEKPLLDQLDSLEWNLMGVRPTQFTDMFV